MCYWGIALALGPNINAPMDDAAVPEALAALEKAVELAPGATPGRAGVHPGADHALLGRAGRGPRSSSTWRTRTRCVTWPGSYPDDLDAVTLFGEALMDLSPWQYWTPDGQATEYTPEIVATLESVLARNPNHPGANHYYIHAVEASRTPERALPSARAAGDAGPRRRPPDPHALARLLAGRAVSRTPAGSTRRRSRWTRPRSGAASSGADQGSHGFYSLSYYPHNIHFLFAASQMQGRSELALTAARKLVGGHPGAGVPRRCRRSKTSARCRSSRWSASAGGRRSWPSRGRPTTSSTRPASGTGRAAWPTCARATSRAAAARARAGRR